MTKCASPAASAREALHERSGDHSEEALKTTRVKMAAAELTLTFLLKETRRRLRDLRLREEKKRRMEEHALSCCGLCRRLGRERLGPKQTEPDSDPPQEPPKCFCADACYWAAPGQEPDNRDWRLTEREWDNVDKRTNSSNRRFDKTTQANFKTYALPQNATRLQQLLTQTLRTRTKPAKLPDGRSFWECVGVLGDNNREKLWEVFKTFWDAGVQVASSTRNHPISKGRLFGRPTSRKLPRPGIIMFRRTECFARPLLEPELRRPGISQFLRTDCLADPLLGSLRTGIS